MVLWTLYKSLFILLLLADGFVLCNQFISGTTVCGKDASEYVLARLAEHLVCQDLAPEWVRHPVAAIITYPRLLVSTSLRWALGVVQNHLSMAAYVAGMFPHVWMEDVRGEIQQYQTIARACWSRLTRLVDITWIFLTLRNILLFLDTSAFSLRIAITLIGLGLLLPITRWIPSAAKATPSPVRVLERSKKHGLKPRWAVDNWRRSTSMPQDRDESDEEPLPKDAWVTPRTRRRERMHSNLDRSLVETKDNSSQGKWFKEVRERFAWFALGGLVVWAAGREVQLRECQSSLG